jgi:hypothetical protein
MRDKKKRKKGGFGQKNPQKEHFYCDSLLNTAH